MINASSAFSDSKKHLKILDALRGVAALTVVVFHTQKIYSGGDHVKTFLNHGYLAVDFFFMMSGYVMAHAYDDRWDRMTVMDFFKRRIIRLHPMVILGMTIGALCFYFGKSEYFPGVAGTPIWKLLLVMLIGYTLIPVPPSMSIRGWYEMYPLNGPAWSLFLEYIANLLYAHVLRRLSKIILAVLVFVAAAALVHLAVTSSTGDIHGGWTIELQQLRIGFTRLLFPFMAGMLLRRSIEPGSGKNTFLLCSLLLIISLWFPRVGGYNHFWVNGLYDSLTVILIFPVIIYLASVGTVRNKFSEKVCTFLGDISYPVYIIHFPFYYIFYAWVTTNKIPIGQGTLVGVGLVIVITFFSYLSLKLYDEPVRKWLSKRFLRLLK